VLLTGGVLTAAGEEAAFAELERRWALPAENTSRLWHELLAPSELGEIPELDVWVALAGQVSGVEPAAVRSAMLDMISPLPSGVAALRALHSLGWRTALATNHLISWTEEWRVRFEWFNLFDVVVCSSEIGLRKPDPRVYSFVKTQLGARHPWFVDDRLENVAAAQRCGFRGVWARTDSEWVMGPSLAAPPGHER
jgi:putative hydrolase of the HAD superfamily